MMRRCGASSCRRAGRNGSANDEGFAVVEGVAAITLLMVPVAMLVMLLPQWPQRVSLASSAASEAAATIVNADDLASGVAAATAVVAETAANNGAAGSLTLTGVSGGWCRGCVITVTVRATVPAVVVQGVVSVGSFTYDTSASARVEDYRSGVAP